MLKLILLLSVIGEFKPAPDVSYSLTSGKEGSLLYRATIKQLVVTYDLKTLRVEPEAGVKKLEQIDFTGVVAGGWAVLFHNEASALKSTGSFEVAGEGKLKFMICGLAPGGWEIWRNGWLLDDADGVDARSGVLYFEGSRGSYFIRHAE
jgi:hypothetical protein